MQFKQTLYMDIIKHIMQTELWDEIEKSNPMIDASAKRLNALLDNLRGPAIR